ncbi:MAG: hypothetical protein ACI4S1_03225 [Roseburia sp.]
MSKRIVCGVASAMVLLMTACGSQRLPSKDIDFEKMVINENVIEGEMNKESVVACFTTLKDQTVYTVGTIHGEHYNEERDYSIKDIESLLINIDPDYIFIEAREETLEMYDVIDGPIEMIFAYSYGKEHSIPVKLIDYWEINNDFMSNSTDDYRDNQIFLNIDKNLTEIEEGKTIVVLYGASHFYFQKPRIEMAGWSENEIDSVSALFESDTDEFVYPNCMEEEIGKKIDYAETILPEIAKENITDKKVLDDVQQSACGMQNYLTELEEVIRQERLYY